MLKKILIAVVSLMGLVLAVGFVLPPRYRVERGIIIQAPSEAIYEHVADVSRWGAWTPWTSENLPDIQWRFGGSKQGQGAVRSWQGPRGDHGTLSLIQADPKTGVTYDASVGEGHYRSRGTLSFSPTGAGAWTWVTWVEEGSVGGNPLMHYLVPRIEQRLGEQLHSSLEKLRKHVEASLPPKVPVPEPTPASGEQAATPSTPVPPPAAPPVEGSLAETPPPTNPPGEAVPVTAAPMGGTPPAEGTPSPAPVETESPAAVPATPGEGSVPAATEAGKAGPPGEPAPAEAGAVAPASTSVAVPPVPPT